MKNLITKQISDQQQHHHNQEQPAAQMVPRVAAKCVTQSIFGHLVEGIELINTHMLRGTLEHQEAELHAGPVVCLWSHKMDEVQMKFPLNSLLDVIRMRRCFAAPAFVSLNI